MGIPIPMSLLTGATMKFIIITLLFTAVLYASAPTDIAGLIRKAEGGDTEAQLQLADAYEKGEELAQNTKAAFEWRRKAAEQGNAKAQNALGVMYRQGIGVAQNKEEAVRWYKKAAAQGLPEADYNVAISYFNGDGIARDPSRAYAWMLMAERHGNSSAPSALKKMRAKMHTEGAKILLAEMLLKGEETPIDVNGAVSIVTEAIHDDSDRYPAFGGLEFEICQAYADGKHIAQNYGEARLWCRRAAEDEVRPAFVMLGQMAEQGLGGTADLKQADTWYTDAALLAVPQGYIQLAQLKCRSNSHDDLKEAYYWLSVAQQEDVTEATPLLQEIAKQLTNEEMEEQQKRASNLVNMSFAARLEEVRYSLAKNERPSRH